MIVADFELTETTELVIRNSQLNQEGGKHCAAKLMRGPGAATKCWKKALATKSNDSKSNPARV
jgi:hypothetical protein